MWGTIPNQGKIHNSPPLPCRQQYAKRFGGDIDSWLEKIVRARDQQLARKIWRAKLLSTESTLMVTFNHISVEIKTSCI